MVKYQPMEILWKVEREHIEKAIKTYRNDENVQSRFKKPKSDYVRNKNELHPTKQVFAKALNISMALNRVCTPQDFKTDMARRVIRERGFRTISTQEIETPRSEDDLSCFEGGKKLVQHLYKERSPQLSRKKKNSMRNEKGYLECEICRLIPSNFDNQHGEACIEVHHTKPLATYVGKEETDINDLQCLCANCHRIEHAKLRAKRN